jgi:hypothetical protein
MLSLRRSLLSLSSARQRRFVKPKRIRPLDELESQIQQRICAKLRSLGWFVKETHGSMFQTGFPDLFACHSRYGQRWIEVKRPKGYKFTPAQLEDFPKICANGSGVWILTDETDESIETLFKKPNWQKYLLEIM